MEFYLKQLKLWKVVSGDYKRPKEEDDKSNVDALQAWDTRNICAQMKLILHCENRQVQMVRTLSTPKFIWKIFNNNYEHIDFVYQVSLIKALVNNTMQEGQSATKFLDGWQALLDEVLIFGMEISEKCSCERLFSKLGGLLLLLKQRPSYN